jgi:glycerol-3-phosphate dehydrogenase
MMTKQSNKKDEKGKLNENYLWDVVVIGGGVVGLACARAAQLRGYKCALVEARPDLLDEASGRNSGIACTGVDAVPESLERALIRDSISMVRPFMRAANLPYRDCGSLVCLFSSDESSSSEKEDPRDSLVGTQQALEKVAQESWDAGDLHVCLCSPSKVHEMEHNVNVTDCLGGVHIPGEIVLDPWLFPIALACQARENKCTIFNNFRCSPSHCSFHSETKVWTLVRHNEQNIEKTNGTDSNTPSILKSRAVINATGINSDLFQLQMEDAPTPSWEARPRRGQYQVFSSPNNTGAPFVCRPIQPVPTQFSKGVFLFTTLYNQIVVGPTALDQKSRTDDEPHPDVAEYLKKCAQGILPNVELNRVGEYVGIRPGSNHRDYQIQLHHDRSWITVAGIRSTGLTASLGIGKYVTRLLQSIALPQRDLTITQHTPLPDVADLVRDYHHRGDGTVLIQGYSYKVTHPLTRLGWEAQSGLATTQ